MTSFHRRVKSSKIQVVKQGEDCSLESNPPRLNRWLTQPAEGTARYRHQANKIQHTGAGFRGLNPNRRGRKVSSEGRSSSADPGRLRTLGDPLREGSGTRPPRRQERRCSPRAAGQGGAEGGPPAPPRRLRGLVAGPWPRPRERLPERLGPGRCPTSGCVPPAAHSPPSQSARPQDGLGRAPRRARTPARRPGPSHSA